MPLPARPSLSVLALGALLAAGSACESTAPLRSEEIVSAAQHGRFREARDHARRLAEANPRDAHAQQLYRDAELAFVLDQGRTEVFQGDLTRALEIFEQADALAPEHPSVLSWIRKTRVQLAVQWLDRAAELTGPEHLREAEEAYEKVLQYDPENAAAREGLAHALLLQNYRAGMSKTYFDDGLTSFRDLELQRARRDFQVSRRYEENEPAKIRGAQVETMLAEERLAQARELEDSGRFFAARNEYRLVLLIDPEDDAARAGLDRMDREARATRTLAEADMALRRGELEAAEESLAEAEVLTDAQADHVSLLQSSVDERRLEDMYLAARSLADDYRYPQAVEAYEALLAVAPDYKDAALRQTTLEEFIRLAEEFYAKAIETTDDAVAEEYLRAIHPVIWPEYKDVVERLKAIEARKAEPQPAVEEPAPEPPGDPVEPEPR